MTDLNGMLINILTLSNLITLLLIIILMYVIVKWGYFKHHLFKETIIVVIALIFSLTVKKLVKIDQFDFGFDEEIAIVLIHTILSSLIGFSLLFIIVYWKSIYHSFQGIWGKDYVLKIVARDLIDDVLNAQSKIKYTTGVKNITRGLETGSLLYTHHFVKLLSISADLKPDIILGCWNTTWYPVHRFFKINSSNDLIINEEWASYFENLEKAYNKSSKKNQASHKRIFIVDNPEKVINDIRNKDSVNFIYWFALLQTHKRWNVNEFYFISKNELEEKINDGFNSEIPNYRDFAIFIKKGGLGLKKYWCFAQEFEPTNEGISNVIYSEGEVVKKVKHFFFDENRWQSKIHAVIEGEQLIIKDNNEDK